jgi:hypothetical protein
MKTVLTVIFSLFTLIMVGQIKYPIQTIYKGDSVVILSIKQSIDINRAIDTQKKIIREQSRKITALNNKIDSLNSTAGNIPSIIDSLKYIADTTYKWADELNMTLWEYATHGAFIYTVPPYNKLYFVNLDDYNLYTHDYGSVFVFEKMTEQEYIEYKKIREEYNKLFPPAVNYFQNLQFYDFQDFVRRYENYIWKNKIILEKELKQK